MTYINTCSPRTFSQLRNAQHSKVRASATLSNLEGCCHQLRRNPQKNKICYQNYKVDLDYFLKGRTHSDTHSRLPQSALIAARSPAAAALGAAGAAVAVVHLTNQERHNRTHGQSYATAASFTLASLGKYLTRGLHDSMLHKPIPPRCKSDLEKALKQLQKSRDDASASIERLRKLRAKKAPAFEITKAIENRAKHLKNNQHAYRYFFKILGRCLGK